MFYVWVLGQTGLNGQLTRLSLFFLLFPFTGSTQLGIQGRGRFCEFSIASRSLLLFFPSSFFFSRRSHLCPFRIPYLLHITRSIVVLTLCGSPLRLHSSPVYSNAREEWASGSSGGSLSGEVSSSYRTLRSRSSYISVGGEWVFSLPLPPVSFLLPSSLFPHFLVLPLGRSLIPFLYSSPSSLLQSPLSRSLSPHRRMTSRLVIDIPLTWSIYRIPSGYTPFGARSLHEMDVYNAFFAHKGDPIAAFLLISAKDGQSLTRPVSIFCSLQSISSLLQNYMEEVIRALDFVSGSITHLDKSFYDLCTDWCLVNEPIRQFAVSLLSLSPFPHWIHSEWNEYSCSIKWIIWSSRSSQSHLPNHGGIFPSLILILPLILFILIRSSFQVLGKQLDLSANFFGVQGDEKGSITFLRVIGAQFRAGREGKKRKEFDWYWGSMVISLFKYLIDLFLRFRCTQWMDCWWRQSIRTKCLH